MTRKGLRKGLALAMVIAYATSSLAPSGFNTVVVSANESEEVVEIVLEKALEESEVVPIVNVLGEDAVYIEEVSEDEVSLAAAWYAAHEGMEINTDEIEEEILEAVSGVTPRTASEFGAFLITGGESGKDFIFDESAGTLTVLTSTQLMVQNVTPAVATQNRIIIADDVEADLIFNGVNISCATNSAVTLYPDQDGNGVGATLHLTLADESTNTIRSTAPGYAGIRVGETTELVIDDSIRNISIDGEMIVPGHDLDGQLVMDALGRIPYDVTMETGKELSKGDRITHMDIPSDTRGELYTYTYGGGAAIGGIFAEDSGTIIINGGYIQSTGGTGPAYHHGGAAIGGGSNSSAGVITINGGEVLASTGNCSAAIGGGYLWLPSHDAIKADYFDPPARKSESQEGGRAGLITINGGYSKATATAHGSAFGDGCTHMTMSKRGYEDRVLVTGGTLLASATKQDGGSTYTDSGTPADGGGYQSRTYYGVMIRDMAVSNGGVYVLGGSLKANNFGSNSPNSPNYDTIETDGGIVIEELAYGNMEATETVFQTTIDLSGYGDRAKKALVESLEMKINGKLYPQYGAPSYTDESGCLYLWLPEGAETQGAEISVDLEVISNTNGEIIKTDTFFLPSVGDEDLGNTLKQYESSEIIVEDSDFPDAVKEMFNKTYDGLELCDEDSLKAEIVKLGIVVENPENEVLDDPEYMSFSSNKVTLSKSGDEEETLSAGLASNVGTYEINVTSTEHAAAGTDFEKSFWGHRVTFLYGNITPADTRMESSMSIEPMSEEEDLEPELAEILSLLFVEIDTKTQVISDTNVLTPLDVLEINIKVAPETYEGINCESPEGTVQVYMNGQPFGGEIQLEPVDEDDKVEGEHNYSEVTLKWNPLTEIEYMQYVGEDGILELTAEYTKGNDNYYECEVLELTTLTFNAVDLDLDGDGLPDVNIDTDGDGIPDLNIDVDGDFVPDVNIDTNGDGKPDVNIDTDGDKNPDLNIDTDGSGTWKPSLEGGNSDGIWKPDTSVDTNGDGEGNYTSTVKPTDKPTDKDGDGVDDNWKPNVEVGVDTTGDGEKDFVYGTAHPDTNLDTDGDGEADLNVDTDGDGKPDLNVDVDGDGIPDVNVDTDGDGEADLNLDTDGDGEPDTNVDVDGDGIPDINIDTNGDGFPDVNVDTTGDGVPNLNIDTDLSGVWKSSLYGGNSDGIWKPDTSVDTNGDGEGNYTSTVKPTDKDGDGVDDNWSPIKNVDKDGVIYDTIHPDMNMDTTGDGKADLNVDTTGDGEPDLNIDLDGDGEPDLNIDLDGDGEPDLNIDLDGDGEPDLNIDLDGDGKADLNVDTDGDGEPDLNIDTDGDGVPDLNIDSDGNGIIDTEETDEDIDLDGDTDTDGDIDTDDGAASDSTIDGADTSDNTNVALYLMLAIMSLAVILFQRKRIIR